MRTAFVACALLFLAAAPARAQEPADSARSLRAPLDVLQAQPVWAAEREFARLTGTVGIRAGFLSFLANDAVVFMPRATDARQHYDAVQPAPMVLAWAPAIAEASAADDLGYTTGPYELRDADGASLGHGWYFSIWRRNAERVWEVVLDIGTPTAEPPPAPPADVEVPRRDPAPPGDAAARTAQLLVLDDLIAAAAQQRSAQRALATTLHVDARHNDGGHITRGGVPVVQSLLDQPMAFRRLGHGVSAAADLGYTYGEYTFGGAASEIDPDGNWVRVWRVGPDGRWQVVHLVTAPITR